MISGIIKVEASVIGRGQMPRLITLAETLIIPNITKTEFSYCFIIHCFIENIQKLLREMCVDFICASLKIPGQTHQAAASLETTQVRRSITKGALCMHCAQYNPQIYTIIMLVHKIMRILKISRGLLANQNADSEYNV